MKKPAPPASPARKKPALSAPLGLVAASVAALALLFLAAQGVSALAKSMDPYAGEVEPGPEGEDGSSYDPFDAGSEATYDDGLRVTVGAPETGPLSGTVRIEITYENNTGESLVPGHGAYGDSVSSYDSSAALVVRAGAPDDEEAEEAADGSDIAWLDIEEVERRLGVPLADGESVTVPVEIRADRPGMPVTVEVTPYGPGHRDTLHWALTVQ